MTKNEKQDLEALKIGFENTEWDDFLLVLNEIRDRDKETIAMYRKSHIELKDLKKALVKEEKANTPEPLYKQEPKALIIDGVSNCKKDSKLNKLETELDKLQKVHGEIINIYEVHNGCTGFKFKDGAAYRVKLERSFGKATLY